MSDLAKAHRLFAPRVAYLIGTRSADDTPNLIPVSNLTSVSTEPEQIAIAVHKRWQTYRNLNDAHGFTVSVPHVGQLDGVWKLGAKYSRYPYVDNMEKIGDSGLSIDHGQSAYGPVLSDGIGWATCHIVARLDFGGDHGIYVGQIEGVTFNPRDLNTDGTPCREVRPAMQVTGNIFTTAADLLVIPYHAGDAS